VTRLKLLGAGGGLVAALVVAGCGMSSSSHDSRSMATPMSPTATSLTASHNGGDVMFASMMIPHHRQAIEMADRILAKDGTAPKVTDLATRIKAAQVPEITQMSSWLPAWGANPSPSSTGGMGGMGHGGGMSQAEMDALEEATGAKATELFLTGMVKHHQGAVTMAQTELDQGQNAEAKAVAQNIITSQKAEIAEMNQLLGK